MYAKPTSGTSPPLASMTRILDALFRRCARTPLKTGGMCCAITIGAPRSAGRPGRTTARALGPPVETPMATISASAPPDAGGKESTADRAGGRAEVDGEGGAGPGAGTMGAPAAWARVAAAYLA